MTNEEALGILKTEWSINAEIFNTNFHEALEIAIKALEEIDLIKFNIYALNKLIEEAEKNDLH